MKFVCLHIVLLFTGNVLAQNDSLNIPLKESVETKTRTFLWRRTEVQYQNGLKSVKSIQRRWFTGNLLLANEFDRYPIRRIKVWNQSGKLVSKITNKPSKSRCPKVRSVYKDYHENGRFKSKKITKRKKMDCMHSTLGEYRVKNYDENGKRIRIQN